MSDIDSIPWDEHEHAYGPASDIPQLLRKLTDKKPRARTKALADLRNRIAHQGWASPVAVQVVPFLIELLEEGSSERSKLLTLLADLSVGGDHGNLVGLHGTFEELVGIGVTEELRREVARGQAMYAGLLGDDDAKTRAAAGLLLAVGGWDDEAATLAQLADAVGTEKNNTTLASLICSLGFAARRAGEALPEACAKRAKHKAALVRAAVGVAQHYVGDKVAHIKDLTALVKKGKPVAGLVFYHGDIVDLSTTVVASYAVERGDMKVLAGLLRSTKGTTRGRVAELGLALILPPADGPRIAESLSAPQVAYLKLLNRHRLYSWSLDYERYGIPARDIARYLSSVDETKPLDVVLNGTPLWRTLFDAIHGKISRDAWTKLLKAELDEAGVVALCRDAWSSDAYLLNPWPPHFARFLDVEGSDNDRVIGLWVDTLASCCREAAMRAYLESLSRGSHRPEEVLVAAGALAKAGIAVDERYDELLQKPMGRCAPMSVRAVLALFDLDRRRRFLDTLPFVWRLPLIDLYESSEAVDELLEGWALGKVSAPRSWTVDGLMSVREVSLGKVEQMLKDIEPPQPKGREHLEAFVAKARG